MKSSIFKAGQLASNEYFTNQAYVNLLVEQDETKSYSIADVIFEAGARNNWHTHPVGQILLVTDGTGYYQEKDKPAQVIKKGDVVVIPSNTEHWHGANPNESMTHIAITNNNEEGPVKWLSPVTDDEYNALEI